MALKVIILLNTTYLLTGRWRHFVTPPAPTRPPLPLPMLWSVPLQYLRKFTHIQDGPVSVYVWQTLCVMPWLKWKSWIVRYQNFTLLNYSWRQSVTDWRRKCRTCRTRSKMRWLVLMLLITTWRSCELILNVVYMRKTKRSTAFGQSAILSHAYWNSTKLEFIHSEMTTYFRHLISLLLR